MIMISMVITVQPVIRVDGDIIVAVTILTLTDNHLMYMAQYSSVR